MRYVRNLILLLICFISYQGFSQNSIEEGTYLSEDKLTVITILAKNEVSYIEYNQHSPYSDSLKNLPKNQFCGTKFYEILTSGFGKYSIKNSSLNIKFETNVKSLDSSNIKTLSGYKERDSIVLKFRINSYPENNLENSVYGVHINSDKNRINLNTNFENQVELKLPKSKTEINFLINDHYELKVKPEKSLVIDLNFNLYKTMITESLKDKVVDFSSFKKVSR
ncbi:hypothetical protein [uncultured Christiangramia sp.]|uniref:hypothetical protein n=1 Tax=Christiangramia sp. 3-2217-3z TaxID=3417564 RepID=UPI0026173404|nr:hypothetical protein [uncultured Christiangramia sp.]